jgi:RsiW-degrading membrane proteinase PrsW (M82 family)
MWLWVLAIGAVLLRVEQSAIGATGNPNLVPSLLLLGGLLIPVSFVFYIDGRSPVYDIPLSALLASGLLGGVLGTVVASVLEFDTLRRLGSLPMLGVGVIEEAAKMLVPLGVLLFTRYRANPADGLLVGVTVGTGFAVLESLGYGLVALVASRGNLGEVESLLLIRGALSPAGHAAWTGLTAASLWHAYNRQWAPRAMAGLVGTFVLVVILHTAWDSIGTWYGYVIVGLISIVLLLRETHRNVLLSPPQVPWKR